MLRKALTFLLACTVCLSLCGFVMAKVMKLKRADLRIPLIYWSDSLFTHAMVKGMIDNRWYWENDYVGAPGRLQMYDFPMADNLHFAVMKLISLFIPDFAVVGNIYYLLTFPLVALCSLCVFRHFKIAHAPALLGSLLFSFLPYHFQRTQGHLFLSAYYLVPPMVMVVLWVCRGQVLWRYESEEGKPGLDLFGRRSLISVGLCLLVSSAGIYYAFFACYLLGIAGIAACISRRSILPLGPAAFLVFVLCLGAYANLYPSFTFWRSHGPNPEAGSRRMAEAEVWALKIAQLVLPVGGHRLRSFDHLEGQYVRQTSLCNTNDYLGAIGCMGLLLLLARLPWRTSGRARSSLLDDLLLLTVAALLLATVGGLGSLFSLLVSTGIRCYYRMSVYIAFFCLFAAVIGLDRLSRRYLTTWKTLVAGYGLTAALLLLGILDQTGRFCVTNYAYARGEFLNDRAFVNTIEASVPKDARIFQLPYKPFPETGMAPHRLHDYEFFRAYLHSRTLRWSYGAMRNREADLWQAAVVQKPLPQLVETLALAGFSGLYIDRSGFPDAGAALERDLASLLGVKPLVSENNRMTFLNLTAYRRALRSRYSADEWQARRRAALHPLRDTPQANFPDGNGMAANTRGSWKTAPN